MTLQEMLTRWKEGRRTKGRSLWTDGTTLFSYRLPIGRREKGKLVVYDYAGKVSGTTTRHVNLAKDVADEVREPPGKWSRKQ